MINKSSLLQLSAMMASFVLLFLGSNAEAAIMNVPFTLITTYSNFNGINVDDKTTGILSYDDSAASAYEDQGSITYSALILSMSIFPLSGYMIPTINSSGPGRDFVTLGSDGKTIVGLGIQDAFGGDFPILFSIFAASRRSFNLDWDYTMIGYTVNRTAQGIIQFEANTVPLPAAAWLFGSGLISLVNAIRKRKSA